MKVPPAGTPIRVLTHNIRYATSSLFEGEQPWDKRAQGLINELCYTTRNQDAFICLQEVLHNQLIDVLSGLNTGHPAPESSTSTAESGAWAYIGIGRDDGHQAGEYSPIFYQPSVWELRRWETVWLSETPDVPSKGWDAASIRIVTIGLFTHHVSRQTVLAMNTHLDDQGSHSRLEAAHMIIRKVSEYQNGPFGNQLSGVFLAGDFNSQEHQEAYSVLTGSQSPFVDAAKRLDFAKHYGNTATWTGFNNNGPKPKRIDYILLGSLPDRGTRASHIPWEVEGYAVLANQFDDGVMNSDHRAVVVDVNLHT